MKFNEHSSSNKYLKNGFFSNSLTICVYDETQIHLTENSREKMFKDYKVVYIITLINDDIREYWVFRHKMRD